MWSGGKAGIQYFLGCLFKEPVLCGDATCRVSTLQLAGLRPKRQPDVPVGTEVIAVFKAGEYSPCVGMRYSLQGMGKFCVNPYQGLKD